MNIIITGATGFIGKNLIEKIDTNRSKVFCVVRQSSRSKDIGFLEKYNVNIIKCDLLDIKDIDSKLKKHIDNDTIIIHLAAQLGSYNLKYEDLYNNNYMITKNLLSIMDGQRFIHCSTAGVYGPVDNADEKTIKKPYSDYEKTKYMAEKLVKEYKNHIILRPERVYGKYDLHLLIKFKIILSRFPIIIGKGNNLIQPTYVDDFIRCILNCINSDIRNEDFNIAGVNPISNLDFYKLVRRIANKKRLIIKIPLFIAFIYVKTINPALTFLNINPLLTNSTYNFLTKSKTFNINKAKKYLDYNPIDVKDGLKKTIAWYKSKGLI